jgi:hypothetical protein
LDPVRGCRPRRRRALSEDLEDDAPAQQPVSFELLIMGTHSTVD